MQTIFLKQTANLTIFPFFDISSPSIYCIYVLSFFGGKTDDEDHVRGILLLPSPHHSRVGAGSTCAAVHGRSSTPSDRDDSATTSPSPLSAGQGPPHSPPHPSRQKPPLGSTSPASPPLPSSLCIYISDENWGGFCFFPKSVMLDKNITL